MTATNHITVLSATTHIQVDMATSTVSVVLAGPQGPAGADGGGALDGDNVVIDDAGGYFADTDAEAVLQEVGSRLVAVENDPEITVATTAPSSPDTGDIWVELT